MRSIWKNIIWVRETYPGYRRTLGFLVGPQGADRQKGYPFPVDTPTRQTPISYCFIQTTLIITKGSCKWNHSWIIPSDCFHKAQERKHDQGKGILNYVLKIWSKAAFKKSVSRGEPRMALVCNKPFPESQSLGVKPIHVIWGLVPGWLILFSFVFGSYYFID